MLSALFMFRGPKSILIPKLAEPKVKLDPAVTDARVAEICMKWTQIVGLFKLFLFISYNGKNNKPLITDVFAGEYCGFLDICYCGV